MIKLAEKLAKKYNIASKLVSDLSHQYMDNVVNYIFDDKFEQQVKSQLAIQFVFPSLMEIYLSDKDNLKRKYLTFSSIFNDEKKRDKFINFDINDTYILATKMVKLLTVKELHEGLEPSQLLTVSIVFSPDVNSIRGEATKEMTNDIFVPAILVKMMVREVTPYLSEISNLLDNGEQLEAEKIVISIINSSKQWDKFFNIIKSNVMQHEVMHSHTLPHMKDIPYVENQLELDNDDLKKLDNSLYFHSEIEQPSMKNDFLLFIKDRIVNLKNEIQGMNNIQALNYIEQNILDPFSSFREASFDLDYIKALYDRQLAEGNEDKIKFIEKRWGYRNTNDVFNTINKNIRKFYLYIWQLMNSSD